MRNAGVIDDQIYALCKPANRSGNTGVFTHVFQEVFSPMFFFNKPFTHAFFSSMFFFSPIFFLQSFHPCCFHPCFSSPMFFTKFSHMFFFHPCLFLPFFFTSAFFSHAFSPMFFHSCCLYKPIKFLQPHFQSSSKFLSTYLTFLSVLVSATKCSFGKINNVYNILYCICRIIRSRLEKSRWPIAKNEQCTKNEQYPTCFYPDTLCNIHNRTHSDQFRVSTCLCNFQNYFSIILPR